MNEYNNARLHSAIDCVTPADRLAGRHTAITATRDSKLEAAREHELNEVQAWAEQFVVNIIAPDIEALVDAPRPGVIVGILPISLVDAGAFVRLVGGAPLPIGGRRRDAT